MKKTMIRLLYVLLLLWTTALGVSAGDNVVEYDRFRALSSEELMEKGRTFYTQRQPAQALACFTIVSERTADTAAEQQLRARALNNCACVYKFFYFDYTQAYEYFTQAYDYCEQTNYQDFLPVVMVNLGDLLNDYSVNYNSKPLAQQAHGMFEKCIDKAVESKNWELLTTAFFNLANQNYELELTKYHDILFSKEIPDATPDLTYVRLQYQGIRHMQQKEYAQARQCFEQQLQHITTRWAPERDSLASLISIATTYHKEQKIAQSIDYLTRALQLTVDQDISDVSASICLQLSEQYRTLGNDEETDRYHQRYMELMEQMHVSQLSHIAELNYINALKKEEAHTQVLEQRQFMQQMALLAGLIMLVIAIAFSLLLWRKNRDLRERNKSLYEKNRQVIKMEADAQQLRKVYSKSSLNDEQRESLVLRIQEVLDDADIICQQDFTLGKLAKLINSNTTYVSQVINEKYGMTFSTLLGSLRIKVACQWMDDPARSGNITIEAIATGTGFKSRTAFVNTFKRETGLKPSEFLRMAKSTEVSS